MTPPPRGPSPASPRWRARRARTPVRPATLQRVKNTPSRGPRQLRQQQTMLPSAPPPARRPAFPRRQVRQKSRLSVHIGLAAGPKVRHPKNETAAFGFDGEIDVVQAPVEHADLQRCGDRVAALDEFRDDFRPRRGIERLKIRQTELPRAKGEKRNLGAARLTHWSRAVDGNPAQLGRVPRHGADSSTHRSRNYPRAAGRGFRYLPRGRPIRPRAP